MIESVAFVSQKYKKVFRLVYSAYAMTGYRVGDAI